MEKACEALLIKSTLAHCVPGSVLLFAAAELQRVLEPFLLRRVKSEVAVDLPKKTELVMYHGMSALQKKYYKALLMKDLGETPALWCVTQSILDL